MVQFLPSLRTVGALKRLRSPFCRAPSGVLPLSVLATPRAQRADEYELSDNARAVLAKVLQKDLPADDV